MNNLKTGIKSTLSLFKQPGAGDKVYYIELAAMVKLVGAILKAEAAWAKTTYKVVVDEEELANALKEKGIEPQIVDSENKPNGRWAFPVAFSPYLLANTPQRVALRERVLRDCLDDTWNLRPDWYKVKKNAQRKHEEPGMILAAEKLNVAIRAIEAVWYTIDPHNEEQAIANFFEAAEKVIGRKITEAQLKFWKNWYWQHEHYKPTLINSLFAYLKNAQDETAA